MIDPVAPSLTDSDRETIARTLEIGGWISLFLLVTGTLLMLALPGSWASHFVIRAGVVTLLATPVARILVSARIFARSRNRTFLRLCLVSIAVIAVSVAVGIWGSGH